MSNSAENGGQAGGAQQQDGSNTAHDESSFNHPGDSSLGDTSADGAADHSQQSQLQDGQQASQQQPTTDTPGNGYSTTLSGDPLMVIDKSKIPRPYKCPFPNCDKAFYRLEQ